MLALGASIPRLHQIAFWSFMVDHIRVTPIEVGYDLGSRSVKSQASPFVVDHRTLPHEKQRMGMIIFRELSEIIRSKFRGSSDKWKSIKGDEEMKL